MNILTASPPHFATQLVTSVSPVFSPNFASILTPTKTVLQTCRLAIHRAQGGVGKTYLVEAGCARSGHAERVGHALV